MPTVDDSAATTGPVSAAGTSTRYVALLFSVGTVNVIDRRILAILLEPIKHELGASDTEGLMTGFAFVVFFARASIPIARAAEPSPSPKPTGITPGYRKDLEAALTWYRRAAEAGHAEADYNLAIYSLAGRRLLIAP